MITQASSCGASVREQWNGPIVDVDVHANVPSIDSLYPYMGRMWVDWCQERGFRVPPGLAGHYPSGSTRACRTEWRGGPEPAGTTLASMKRDILDPARVAAAVVNCYYAVDSLRHPDWAAALASAVNNWLLAEWLEQDSRLRASIVIPARDPDSMIEEIRRVGAHPGFVQVLLPVRNEQLWGQRHYHRVFAVIADLDLVAGLHFGGTTDGPPSTTGYSSWFVEEYAAEWQAFASQLTSLISEGVFAKFPTLRVSVLEGGFFWLPMWAWRMEKEWKALRREVPWLNSSPVDLIRQRVRLSTAPIEGGSEASMAQVIRWMNNDDALMYASDYPHGYDDDFAAFFRATPESMRPKMMAGVAQEWYRLH